MYDLKEKEENLISMLMFKYVPYWPIFMTLMLVVSIVSSFYIYMSKPQFEATASLIIHDEKKGMEDSKFWESMNLINSKKIIENEVEVLKSRNVIKKVVSDFHLENRLFKKVNYKMEFVMPASIFSVEKKLAKIPAGQNIVFSFTIINKDSIYVDGKGVYSFNEWIDIHPGKIKLNYNHNTSLGIGEKYTYEILTEEDCISQIQKRLKVSATNKLSSVVDLKYRDYHPELAEKVLNGIIQSYNTIAISEKKLLAKNTLKFIEDRLDDVNTDLYGIEKKIQQYKSSTGAVDIGTQGHLFLQNVSQNDQKLSEINLQLSVINQLEQGIATNENNAGIMPANLGINDPNLIQLINSLNQSELDLEKLKKTVAENNPILVSISDQIKKTKTSIRENISIHRKSLEEGLKNIYATNDSYNNMLHHLPTKERELIEISREQNIKNSIYAFLLQKREESELSYVATIPETRIVDLAHAGNEPVSPNKLYILGFALFATISIPASFIGLREAIHSTILYRDELEEYTKLPIWGEVASIKVGNTNIISPKSRSITSEEFRRIRYTIEHKSAHDLKRKIILVTSSISGEGKSFFSAQLASSFAQTGKRVLLIDFDMYNASLNKIFKTDTEYGISDVLYEMKTLDECVHKINGFENLFFLPSGSNNDMPSENIKELKFSTVIQNLKNEYDIIIIDSPPVNLVCDAFIISKFCTNSLFIIRHSYTPKSIVKRLDQFLENNPLENVAVIFNGVKSRGFSNSNYGYGYGYVYNR